MTTSPGTLNPRFSHLRVYCFLSNTAKIHSLTATGLCPNENLIRNNGNIWNIRQIVEEEQFIISDNPIFSVKISNQCFVGTGHKQCGCVTYTPNRHNNESIIVAPGPSHLLVKSQICCPALVSVSVVLLCVADRRSLLSQTALHNPSCFHSFVGLGWGRRASGSLLHFAG